MIAVLALVSKWPDAGESKRFVSRPIQSQIAVKPVAPVNLARQPLGIPGFC